MKKIYLLLFALFCSISLNAQIIITSPAILQQSSQDITIYYNASYGNQGLMDAPSGTKVYAHTWAVLSDGTTTNAPDWATPSTYEPNYVMTRNSTNPNIWELHINSNLRSFYGVTNPSLTITKLGFVFRSADVEASMTGRTESGADIMVDVYDDGLQVVLSSNISGSLISAYNDNATFNVFSTQNATLTLTVNDKQIAYGSGQTLTADYVFPGIGEYTVVATATANGQTVTTTKTYNYAGESTSQNYPGSEPVLGTVKNDDGSVTFCFAAPSKTTVILVGSWNNYRIVDEQIMHYTNKTRTQLKDGDEVIYNTSVVKYFWTTVSGLSDSESYVYYYIVIYKDNQTGALSINYVGDPYAKLVLDPWNDKYIPADVFPDLPAYPFDFVEGVPVSVYNANINTYDWKTPDFKGVEPQDLIIYEMLIRDFTGTEGKALGNGTIRQAIDKIPYLVDLGVNAVELMPIMEFSGNNSWGYNTNFYFAPDKAYGTPDDYKEFIDLCHANGIAVILDIVFNQSDSLHPWFMLYPPSVNQTSATYLYNLNAPHAYSVLNDWRQNHYLVYNQWCDALKYWLSEYKVDGFRFDLVKGLGSNESYASSSDASTNAFNANRVSRMKALHNVIKSVNPNAYFINENLAGPEEENAMADDGELNWANINNAGCQFAMGYSTDSDLNRMYAPLDSRTWGSTVSYLESHDEQRLAYKQNEYADASIVNDTQAKMARLGSAAAQMLMAPGAHMIWQFSEMGNAENTKDNNGGNNTDPKTVEWSLLDNPYNNGLFNSYKELIFIRNNNKDMFRKNPTSFSMNCSASNWALGRSIYLNADGNELYTLVNPKTSGSITISNVPFSNADNADYQIMSQTFNASASFSAANKTVTIPANSYIVIGSKTLSGSNDPMIDDSIGLENSLRAYGGCGEIVVEHTETPVSIFSVDGQTIGSITSHGSIRVIPGIYILKNSTSTIKIAVR